MIGRATVQELLAHGHDVLGVDVVREPESDFPLAQVDLVDLRRTREALSRVEAVVHLANVPGPDMRPPAETFITNVSVNLNVFRAAAELGLRRVVWASSTATLGVPFDMPPRYAPVDEDHYPLPTTSYALSKVVSETIASSFAASSTTTYVALRFSYVVDDDDYPEFPSLAADPLCGKWNLWSYLDVRDAATACRLALEAPLDGAPSFVVAAADAVLDRPTADALREVFPATPLRRPLGRFESVLSSERARRELGFEPRHSWREKNVATSSPSSR
jgi:nucleoside-diphosphate-sugar epimerase